MDSPEQVPVPELKLLTPPPKWDGLTVVVSGVFLVLAAVCFYRGNIIGGCIDLLVVFVNVGLAVWRYRSISKMHEQFRRLKIMHEIINTPRVQEIGNSVVFNYLAPSQELMEEMKKDSPKNKEGK